MSRPFLFFDRALAYTGYTTLEELTADEPPAGTVEWRVHRALCDTLVALLNYEQSMLDCLVDLMEYRTAARGVVPFVDVADHVAATAHEVSSLFRHARTLSRAWKGAHDDESDDPTTTSEN